MGTLDDLVSFGANYGPKVVVLWLLYALAYSEYEERYMFDIGIREWAEITLAAYGTAYIMHNYT